MAEGGTEATLTACGIHGALGHMIWQSNIRVIGMWLAKKKSNEVFKSPMLEREGQGGVGVGVGGGVGAHTVNPESWTENDKPPYCKWGLRLRLHKDNEIETTASEDF